MTKKSRVRVIGLLGKDTYDNLFIMGTVCLSIRSVFGLSQIDNPTFRYLTLVAYALVLLKIIHTEFDKRRLLFFVCGLFIAFCVMLTSGSTIVLGTIVFCYGMIGVDVNKVLKANAIGLITATMFVSYVGILQKNTFLMDTEHSFGFNNPNGFQSFISAFTILFIASNIKKIGVLGLTFWLLVNFMTSTLAGARTGYLVAAFIFILILILKRPGHKNNNYSVKAEKIYIWIVFLTLGCVVLYDYLQLVRVIDTLISGRFYQANHYLMQYGIKLFGNAIVELDPNFSYWHLLLDCGYARLFINYGVIYGTLFVWAHYYILKQARLKGQLNIIVALLGFAVIMIVENGGIGINFNMSLLLLSGVLESDVEHQ